MAGTSRCRHSGMEEFETIKEQALMVDVMQFLKVVFSCEESKKPVISREFMQIKSEIDSLERELKAKEKAAVGIFRADNLTLPGFETYDDLDFYLYKQQGK